MFGAVTEEQAIKEKEKMEKRKEKVIRGETKSKKVEGKETLTMRNMDVTYQQDYSDVQSAGSPQTYLCKVTDKLLCMTTE